MHDSPSNSQLDKILASFLLANETGSESQIETLCQQHPDQASQIRDYFEMQRSIFQSLGVEPLMKADPLEGYRSSFPFPRQIDGIELKRVIGAGGMGVVFEGFEEALSRKVAVKFMKDGALEAPRRLKRFEDEAKIIAQFQHDHIVNVIRCNSHEGRPYMVMELIEGQSLNRVIEEQPLEQQVAAKLIAQVANAVDAAHEQNIIHRDIKPANILCNKELTHTKVTDFGLANWDRETEGVTQTGEILGTAGYLAPEIINGSSRGDASTDIYSMGATLYALLVGHAPFKAATQAETLLLALKNDPVSPRMLNPGIDEDLESICLKSMHPEPEKRYSSAAKMFEDVNRFLRKEPVQARPIGKVERLTRWSKRNRSLAMAFVCAATLLLAFLGSISWGLWSSYRANKELADNIALLKTANRDLEDAKSSEAAERAIAEETSDYILAVFKQATTQGRVSDGSANIAMRDALLSRMPLLKRDFPVSSATKARILARYGELLNGVGLYQQATEVLDEAAEIGDEFFPTEQHFLWWSNLDLDRAEALIGRGTKESLTAAVPLLENHRSFSVTEHEMSDQAQRSCYSNLSAIWQRLGKPEQSLAAARKSIEGLDLNDLHSNQVQFFLNYLSILPNDRNKLKQFETCAALFDRDDISDLDRLRAKGMFGLLLFNSGDYEKSKKVLSETATEAERILGRKNEVTVSSKHNLANAHTELKEYGQASVVAEDVLATRIEINGMQSPGTWGIAGLCLNLYQTLGETEKLNAISSQFEQVVAETKQPDNPRLLFLMNQLAVMNEQQGRFEKAEFFATKVDLSLTRQFGEDDFRTQANRSTLAKVYAGQNQSDKAIKISQGIVEYSKRTKSEDSKAYRDSIVAHVNILAKCEREREAIEAIDLALKLISQSEDAGSKNGEFAVALKTKMDLLRDDESHEKLTELLQANDKLLDSSFPKGHPSHSSIQVLRAEMAERAGDVKGAVRILLENRRPWKGGSTNEFAQWAEDGNRLGVLLQTQDQFSEATEIFENILAKQDELLGQRDSAYLSTLSNLAATQVLNGDLEKAESNIELLIEKNSLQGSSDVRIAQLSLAEVYRKQERFHEANELYKKLASSFQRTENETLRRFTLTKQAVNCLADGEAARATAVVNELLEIEKPVAGTWRSARLTELLGIAQLLSGDEALSRTTLARANSEMKVLFPKLPVNQRRRHETAWSILKDHLGVKTDSEVEQWLNEATEKAH